MSVFSVWLQNTVTELWNGLNLRKQIIRQNSGMEMKIGNGRSFTMTSSIDYIQNVLILGDRLVIQGSRVQTRLKSIDFFRTQKSWAQVLREEL